MKSSKEDPSLKRAFFGGTLFKPEKNLKGISGQFEGYASRLQQRANTLKYPLRERARKSNMASIQSIHDVLKTYQQAFGAEALQTQLALFLKSSASVAAPAKPSSPPAEKSDAPLAKLSGQQLRDIWAELTGRKTGLKSSGKFSNKKDLIAEIERLRAAPVASSAASVVSEEAAPEEKKAKSKRGGPSAWNAFIESVAGKKGSPTPAFLAWKETQVEKKGNLAFSYASSLGKEAFETFKSSYVPPASSASSVASADDDRESVPSAVPSEASTGSKKRGRPAMSAEEKAARAEAKKAEKKAEREAKKAEKKAEKAAAKAAKKAGASLPALPESDDEDESEPVYTEVEIGDETFFWDENTGSLFTREESGSLTRVGTYDGITMAFC